MPRKPAYLTERQKEILEFLADFQRRQGVAPTLREICQHFGFSSYGTVYKHLKLLAQKGFLRRDWNQKRGLELLRAPGGAGPASGAVATELPFYGRIAAGRPIEAVESGETLQVPGHLLGPRPGEHYVLRVVGDSMIEEGIQDGDLVVVLRRDRADPGEMVVALVASEATLKRFYPEGELVRLQPANPAMQPLRVPARDVRVQGVVVGLMRRF
jgi:repressor LexA